MKTKLAGGFNPSENSSQNGNLPQVGVKIKKMKPSPRKIHTRQKPKKGAWSLTRLQILCFFFRGVQFILNSFGNPLLLPFCCGPAPVSKAPLVNNNVKTINTFFPTTQNLHQCTPIWKQKKRVWRAFQHLPFQDPCHLSKSNFSCHLAFYSITNFIKCFISREAFFLCTVDL